MIMSEIDIPYELAEELLKTHGSVRKAVEFFKENR
jgi:N-acetylmuramic acid 6-phosphate etherase